ncbi:hypothetical protein L3Q82_004223 [Scortum barcoo]|uniref:Uncharacterized protein n=1 Tax=Scortum barcoo TaxID=214431 RepID=A0ACB8VJQ2_9TELE|nr:hypothetical protein L3Q82_004223 [Scortum barcoo]
MWKLLRRQRVRHESLFWLLQEPMAHGGLMSAPSWVGAAVAKDLQDCRDFYSWGLDGVRWAGPTGDSGIGSWSGVEIAEERRSTAGSLESLSGGTGAVEDMEQQKKQDSDSGVGSDNGDKRLSTEPSDEDSLSLNVPMSHITEEEGISKDDSSEHLSSLTADPNSDSVRLIEESPTEALRDQFSYRDSALSTRFVNYIKARLHHGRTAADFDEAAQDRGRLTLATRTNVKGHRGHRAPHRHDQPAEGGCGGCCRTPGRVNSEQDDLSGVQLYPVEMVTVEESLNGQDSDDGVTTPKHMEEGGYEFQKKRQMILEKARFEAQLACREYEWHMSIKRDDRSPASGPPSFSSPIFGLKPRSAPPSLPCSPPPSFLDPSLLSQAPPLRRDTPRSRDDGGEHCRVFLRSHKSLESVDPQFTMRRKMEQLREELELMEQLRDSIESRLKVVLPEDLGSSLMDGVVLCHLANHIRPRSVGSIHVPSPAVPKLSMAKCRRNVENFLDACRKIGVPECRLQPVCGTVQALVALDTTSPDRKQEKALSDPNPASSAVSETPSLVSVTTQTPPPAWQIWDLIGSSLLHILCLVLLFDKLCLPHHILEEKGLVKVSMTVQALVDEASPKHALPT